MKRKYLLIKDHKDERDYVYPQTTLKFDGSSLIPATPLKQVVDLRNYCSPIDDQGSLGSCTAHAITGLMEMQMIMSTGTYTDLSRLGLYYMERAMEGTINDDAGAMIRDGVKIAQKVGVPREDLMPYDIAKFTVAPNEHAMADAHNHKIRYYERVLNLNGVLRSLAEGMPVVAGIDIYESFESADVARTGLVPVPNVDREQCLGGHAILFVGYDMNKRVIIVKNSWSAMWGDKGYFYLPFDFFANHLVSDMWRARK